MSSGSQPNIPRDAPHRLTLHQCSIQTLSHFSFALLKYSFNCTERPPNSHRRAFGDIILQRLWGLRFCLLATNSSRYTHNPCECCYEEFTYILSKNTTFKHTHTYTLTNTHSQKLRKEKKCSCQSNVYKLFLWLSLKHRQS